jgi:hypothetical protein
VKHIIIYIEMSYIPIDVEVIGQWAAPLNYNVNSLSLEFVGFGPEFPPE